MFYEGNNKSIITGRIICEPKIQHTTHEKEIYEFKVESPRLSGINDVISVTCSEEMVDVFLLKNNTVVNIQGQFRSYNNPNVEGKKLILTVFAKQIEIIDDKDVKYRNNIFLKGFVCKEPIYRQTPLGKDISDVIIAVNRTNLKSDYIPVIGWNDNAKFIKNLVIGDEVEIFGRIQSRNYDKKIGDTSIKMTAYEVSALKVKAYKKSEIKFSSKEQV